MNPLTHSHRPKRYFYKQKDIAAFDAVLSFVVKMSTGFRSTVSRQEFLYLYLHFSPLCQVIPVKWISGDQKYYWELCFPLYLIHTWPSDNTELDEFVNFIWFLLHQVEEFEPITSHSCAGKTSRLWVRRSQKTFRGWGSLGLLQHATHIPQFECVAPQSHTCISTEFLFKAASSRNMLYPDCKDDSSLVCSLTHTHFDCVTMNPPTALSAAPVPILQLHINHPSLIKLHLHKMLLLQIAANVAALRRMWRCYCLIPSVSSLQPPSI